MGLEAEGGFMSRMGKWTAIAILIAVWAGTGVARAQTGGFSGHVTLQDGTSCVKCIIELDRLSVKGHYTVKTDKKGNYVYVGLPLDNYKITLEDPDGKVLYYFNNVHAEMGEPSQKDFDLPKEMAQQSKENASNPAVQQQKAAEEKQEKEFTSLKQVFDQASALDGQKQYAEAAAMYQKAEPLAKGKNLGVVLEHEAVDYTNAKQYDQAVAVYQKLIAADPANASYHSGLGTDYAFMGKPADAQAECDKAAQSGPADGAKCYFNIGALAHNAGRMDDAAAAFKKTTELDPKNADAFFLEGQSLMGKATMGSDGKIVPAPGTVEALQSYLQLQPNGPHAAEAQGMIQSITGQVDTEYKSQKKKKSS
jgi:tetratricopeptide (TPR) repeat protein